MESIGGKLNAISRGGGEEEERNATSGNICVYDLLGGSEDTRERESERESEREREWRVKKGVGKKIES